MSSPGSMKDNVDVACYFITKHSWKGKYKRIFSVGTLGITTYNPSTLEVTNQWSYREFVSIVPNIKSPLNNEFIITMRKGAKKTEQMKFSTDHRADLLTEALRFRHLFVETPSSSRRFNAFKQHWSDNRVPVALEVRQSSLDQVDTRTNKVLCSYDYKDMEGFAVMSDYPGGVALIHGGFNRLHLFALDNRDEFVRCVVEAAGAFIGISLKQRKDHVSYEDFLNNRLGKYSGDESITSYTEFTVHKLTPRSEDPVRRLFCLSETCVIERDPASYSVCTAKPLCDIFAVIRNQENPQQFSLEYVKGAVRTYTSTDRDALIASIMDGVRASGNRDVHVKMRPTNRGLRLGPFTVPVDEEVESQHMKFMHQPPSGMTYHETVARFNANVSYSGLLHAVTSDAFFAENKERLITQSLVGLLEKEGDQNSVSAEQLEAQFHALRRLVASKAGFACFTKLVQMREKVGLKVVRALNRGDDGITHAAIDMLSALMQPMHDDYDLRQEQMNKASLLSSKSFLEKLLNLFGQHVERGSGALYIAAMLDFLTFALCAPYSETTSGEHFDALLEMVASQGRVLYKLFQHPSMAIVKGAGMVLKAIIEEGEAEVAARMQDLALAEGALPRHLHTAFFTQSSDGRMLTNRQLSRHLVSLWVTGHPTAMSLLKRILPAGLLNHLDSIDAVPEFEEDRMNTRDNLKLAQEHLGKMGGRKRPPQWRVIERQVENALQHWRARIGIQKKQVEQKPIVLRKRRQRIKAEANWPLFYYQLGKDHAKPNLIWNYKTREELRDALENEMRAFTVDRDLGSGHVIAWNHTEFEMHYPSLTDEIKIGDYYLRLLLEEEDESEETSSIKRSYEFFNDLYHRFLLTPKMHMKCMCLQAMAIVYGRCHEEIGAFNDTKYIVGMLDRCTDKLERDRLLLFINKLILNKRNVKELLDANGVKTLVDLLTLAHLHTSRAVVPTQSNLIEAGSDMERESEKEWYYGNTQKERLGPYSFEEMKQWYIEREVHSKTRCWCQGMDGWRPLYQVPQLKWTMMSEEAGVMNESELATLILNMLIKMAQYYPSRDAAGAVIRPLPRAKKMMSDAVCLPHIVQLLLTFDPTLVEKVAVLLMLVVEDNPMLSRLYLSGVFFFILMYTGSNVLPIARLLKYAHIKQAFRSEESKGSDILTRSILGNVLPEAMVCYLENYPAERFAEIFLGEFDTPEAIWSSEMRRMMIEKLAAHLGDYSPRLYSNTRALYQYCPIPVVQYPQLEHELFCNIYYLKHLCDTVKFPDWPIQDPVALLKDILEAWKMEVEKKPPSMSVDEAYTTLGLETGVGGHEERKVRTAYFKLAQKYHPDKNPDGREIFEAVNKAYEFLCSKTRLSEGPDPKNIVLILKAQSILFSRYSDVLEPYKYAGYPMLIKTIKLESHDDSLFSKAAPLLSAAAELAYHTVRCSALNAEELRREQGIEVLQEAFSRCVNVISSGSQADDVAVQVCIHISRCYAVASEFQACREKILEHPSIVKDLCRILYYKNVPVLCSTVVECVSCFCCDFWLQTNLFQSGVLWHLLQFLFHYDYTLDEGGVERSQETNQQEVANRLARLSIKACSRLGGFGTGEESTPDNPPVKKSLSCLLTVYVCTKLAAGHPFEILKLLNSNSETPYLIWDNATRAELNEYLMDQQQQHMKTGECDPSFGADFNFSIHAKELIVGDIFVRIYNEQPTFPLDKPKGFCIDLLDFLGSQAQTKYLTSLLSMGDKGTPPAGDRLRNLEMALEGLRNVIKNNPGPNTGEDETVGVEMQCIGHFKLLFALLRLEACPKVLQSALEVINLVTGNQECVNDIAACDVMAYLLMVSVTYPKGNPLMLGTLHALSSSTTVVKQIAQKGGLIYLLHMFCNSPSPNVRQQAAELLAKVMSDKLVGPRVRLVLQKFLPPIFMDAMRDSPEASVHMFEGTHENPELIWNDEAREKVSDAIKGMKKSFFAKQKADAAARWTPPEGDDVLYSSVQGELAIGGVFLRLFISNPGWVLRKPRDFLTELLEKWVSLAMKDNAQHNELLETVTQAVVLLFTAQPPMLEAVPQLGLVPRFFQVMASKNDAVPKAALQVVHQLANNTLCITAMGQCESVVSIKGAMQRRADAVGFACEALNKMFSSGGDELVEQALSCQMIQFLLQLLEGGIEVENPAAVKAQIVKALKALQRSLTHGNAVSEILEASSVWRDYKDQRHDLFISSSNVSGYLTGAAPAVAGYLTAGTGVSSSSSGIATVPPPDIEHEDAD